MDIQNQSVLVLCFGDNEGTELGQISLIAPKENLTLDVIKPVAELVTSKTLFYDADGVAYSKFLGAYYENTVDTRIA